MKKQFKLEIFLIIFVMLVVTLVGGTSVYSTQKNEELEDTEEVSYEIKEDKIKLCWGEKPTCGYSIDIINLIFEEDTGTITVVYSTTEPSGELVYPSVCYPSDTAKLPVAKEEINEVELSKMRIAGEGRIETAVAVSREGWDTSEKVLIAQADEFADALAGAPLAQYYGAPILLSFTDLLPEETEEEIKRLGAEKVYLLGGNAALSSEVKSDLAKISPELEVNRIGGENRFETAQLIAEKIAPEGSRKAVVTSGVNFKDALIASPYAAAEGYPILLSYADEVPEPTKKAMDNLEIDEAILVGTREKLADEILEQLPVEEVNRISDAEHYSNAVPAAGYFEPGAEKMYVTTGEDFPDAIAGSALASRKKSGILLVGDDVPREVNHYLEEKDISDVRIFGGEKAVSPEIKDDLLGN